ncbi:MAG: RnfABCDGE type electron transport complex subunit D [Rhodospirillaceae bacterium]|nr:RnfABCDGE type electron transport complex subunit D [Rhodospirillaceae bacterium]
MKSPPTNSDAVPTPHQDTHGRRWQEDFQFTLALILPLLVRLNTDGQDVALQRLALLVLLFAVAYGWNIVFTKQIGKTPEIYQFNFAILFSLLLPSPVGWGGAVLAASFGWVFGREIFGTKTVLSPVIIALAFAIFSFPDGGYEARQILSAASDQLLAISCLPGAAWLLWKGVLSWRVVVGAMVGVAATILLMAGPESSWWSHFMLGTFAPGILFIAAAPESMPRSENARWVYGLMVGALIILIRTANPDQPDGVVFAVLLGSLFAPLVDRALNWRPRYE